MAVVHIKQDTRGAFAGTLTVFNSQGSTVTQAASDLIGPPDWNSYHAEAVTVSGNTAGNTSAGSAPNVVMGGVGGFQVRMSTAANAATQWFSRVEPVVWMSEYEPISGSAVITNSSLGQNSIYFVPFYVKKLAYVSRVNFFVSVGTTVSAGNNTGSAAITFSAAMYSRRTDSQDRISRMWSGTLAIRGTKASNTQLVYTNVVGIADSQSVSTVQTGLTTSNATTYPRNSIAGYRVWALPLNSSLTPGRYWMAVAASTTADSAVNRMGIKASVGMQTVGAANQINYVEVGTSSAASDLGDALGMWQGAGTYSATSGAFPVSVPLTSDAVNAGLTLTLPYFNFSGYDTQSSKL